MPSITASQTILEMCDIFSVMGLPNSLVTDNGSYLDKCRIHGTHEIRTLKLNLRSKQKRIKLLLMYERLGLNSMNKKGEEERSRKWTVLYVLTCQIPLLLLLKHSGVERIDSGGSISRNKTVPSLRRSARARRAPDKLDF
ncbi:hypothetical protein RRG08_016905 [Elysia crispata]|uniref:Uncharacterized protein n=1 Tax=Elysia crispata TaxID=231223 RepID=A0AAE0ZF29_9GAST|nr:hypothetical protein RRG08_016905 [Elysia crispata]